MKIAICDDDINDSRKTKAAIDGAFKALNHARGLFYAKATIKNHLKDSSSR